jgi:hypothetical protein
VRASVKKLTEFFSLYYLIFGAFWVLFAVASAFFLWFALHVAINDLAFFLSVAFSGMLLSVADFWAPLFLGAAVGLLIVRHLYGGDIAKQSILYVTRANLGIFFKGLFFLIPIFLAFSFALSTSISALMGILGVPDRMLILPPGSPIVIDHWLDGLCATPWCNEPDPGPGLFCGNPDCTAVGDHFTLAGGYLCFPSIISLIIAGSTITVIVGRHVASKRKQ